MSDDELNKGDELVDIKLPRSQAEVLRTIIKERETYNFLKLKLKNWWIFGVASGFLVLIAFGEQLYRLFK